MPSLTQNSPDGANGKPRNVLAEYLRVNRIPDEDISHLFRPDEVVIGTANYAEDSEDESASWEDVAKVVDGTTWLVPQWIPYGMLSATIAQPKIGKSGWVLGALVRPLILGGPWFNSSPGPGEAYVVWCDTEGSVGINIERARKWELPLDRIRVPFPDDLFRRIDIDNPQHIERILEVVCRYKARLVVVDSFRGAHGGDENNSRIARGLQNLAGVAEKTRAAVHIIHHTGKLSEEAELNANSGRGSNAFLAMVRCLIGIDVPDPESPWRRVRMLGENFGTAPPPVGFRFTETGLDFGSAPERPRKDTKKQSAEDWLRSYMEPGRWYSSAEIDRVAVRFGFSGNAVQRAKESIGIVQPKYVRRVKGGWESMLPAPRGEESGTPDVIS